MLHNSRHMEKNSSHLIDAVYTFLIKSWAYCGGYIVIGLIGKVGLMLRKPKSSSILEDLGSLLVAGFVGYIAAVFCFYKYPPEPGGYSVQAAFIVPMATLLSDRIMTFLLNVNWIPLIELLTGKKGDKKK